MATGGLGNLEKLVERYKHAADAAEDLIQRLDAASVPTARPGPRRRLAAAGDLDEPVAKLAVEDTVT